MFGMGGSEIIVILIVALLFLGPDKLPDAAKQISKGIRDIKKQSRTLQQSIEDDETIGGAIRDLKSALRGEEPPPVRKPPVKPALPAAAAVAALPAAVEPSILGPAVPPEPSTDRPADLAATAIVGVAGALPRTPAESGLTAASAASVSSTSSVAGVAGSADAVDDAPVQPRVRLPDEAGERDPDAPPADPEADDEELASLIRPAPGAVGRNDHG